MQIIQVTSNPIINEDISYILDNNRLILSNVKNKNILITGANGMLPSYLVYFFVAANLHLGLNNNIYVCVRHNKHRLDIIHEKDSNIIFLEWDITQSIHIDVPMHYVIHAASDASPSKYLASKISTINANILGLYNLLALDIGKIESFLYYSTAEMYGNPTLDNIPTKESYIAPIDHLSERSCYVEAKKFWETLCKNYFYERNLPVKMIRPFHVFWPWIDLGDGRVFSDFTANIKKGEDIVIKSDGLATRSFCYLADALDMTIKVLLRWQNGWVYNIGNPNNEISIKDLAHLLAPLSERPIDISILGWSNTSAPLRSCPDISYWIDTAGFSPQYSVLEAFKRTLNSLT
jgi:UDP-glucuronate decarboxylase